VPPRTGRFQQADRLRRSAEFRRVTARGQRAASGSFVVLVSESARTARDPARCRLGITVSRKVGGAVVRNHVKRRIREWFRAERGSLGRGVDWVVIARPPAASLPRSEAEAELSRLSRAVLRAAPRKDAS
jgi:ribonuclease P protein component